MSRWVKIEKKKPFAYLCSPICHITLFLTFAYHLLISYFINEIHGLAHKVMFASVAGWVPRFVQKTAAQGASNAKLNTERGQPSSWERLPIQQRWYETCENGSVEKQLYRPTWALSRGVMPSSWERHAFGQCLPWAWVKEAMRLQPFTSRVWYQLVSPPNKGNCWNDERSCGSLVGSGLVVVWSRTFVLFIIDG